MDFEQALLSAMLADPEFMAVVVAHGIGKSDLDDHAARRAFDFVVKYINDYDKSPGLEEVNSICRIDLKPLELDPKFVLNEMRKRKLFRKMQAKLEKADTLMRANDPDGAEQLLREDDSESTPAGMPTSLFALGPEVVHAYEDLKSGKVTGIAFPWPKLTTMTMGMHPGTVTGFVARPGTGKSFVATLCARKAFQDGHLPILVISPEMKKLELAERYFVIDADVSYSNVVKGTLTDFEMIKLRKHVELLKAAEGVYIMDSKDDLTKASLNAVIRKLKPKLVAIDAIYRLPFRGDSRGDKMESIVAWVGDAAAKYDTAFCIFHQMNRAGDTPKKDGGGMRQSSVALSDQLNWDLQTLFALEQDFDMRADKRMFIHPLKIRRGEHDAPVEVNWDFAKMNFTEIDRGPKKKVAFKDTGYQEEEIPF